MWSSSDTPALVKAAANTAEVVRSLGRAHENHLQSVLGALESLESALADLGARPDGDVARFLRQPTATLTLALPGTTAAVGAAPDVAAPDGALAGAAHDGDGAARAEDAAPGRGGGRVLRRLKIEPGPARMTARQTMVALAGDHAHVVEAAVKAAARQPGEPAGRSSTVDSVPAPDAVGAVGG